VFDYTADGVRRSIEDSLQRMGVSGLDIAFVHDISPDNKLLPTPWQEQFAIALKAPSPPCRGCGRRGSSRAGASA
jgi:D-threo-aldose 1-dehydrogenase